MQSTETIQITNPEIDDPLSANKGWFFSDRNIMNAFIMQNKVYEQNIINFTETIYNIIMDGEAMYISGNLYLYKITTGNYPETDSYYFAEDVKKFNPNQDVIVACSPNDLLSVQTYNGNITIRNKYTLEQIKLVQNIDSPLKAEWSNYHQSYIVMGKNGIWRITQTTTDLIFSVDDYFLKDIAVNNGGQIGIIMSSLKDLSDVVKILHNDFYGNIIKLSYNYSTLKKIINTESFFYVIQENGLQATKYTGNSILIYPKTKTFEVLPIISTISGQKEETTQTTTTKTIEIIGPKTNEILLLNNEYEIKWLSSKSSSDNVSIKLLKGDETVLIITDKTLNSGSYKWKVPTDLELYSSYVLKIQWLSTSEDESNYGLSDSFIIKDKQDELASSDYVSGISYDKFTGNIILSFYGGYIGVYNVALRTFNGLFETTIKDIQGVVANNDQIKQFSDTSKVRIFVGTDKYLNDKWDSGIVETTLKSMYYGGGNNLKPGGKYYVHIQIYSEKYGWSDIQIKEFIMPL